MPLTGSFTAALGRISLTLKKIDESKYSVTFSVGNYNWEKVIGGLREGEYLELKPLPYGHLSEAQCLLYKLGNPAIIPPNREAVIELKAPLSLGIFHEDVLLATFSYPREKLALYGPPDVGDLCIYVNERVIADFLEAGLGPALVKVKVVNRLSKAVEVTKLVLPVKGSGLYYIEPQGFMYSEFLAIINEIAGKVIAETSVQVSQYPNAIELYKPKKDSYVMKYGL